MTLQREIVSRLAGAAELRAGVKLGDRSSIDSKREARAYLSAVLQRFGLSVEHQSYSAEGENLYATLSSGRRGRSEPSRGTEAIVLGAHYDTVRNSPGANDDATGVAAVAGVAQALCRMKGPRTRDVIFVFFDEEERGLRGSRAFAQLLKDEHRAVHSVHTIDQMGWDADGDRAIELELPYDGAADVYQSAARVLGMRIPIHVTKEAGSDHSAFRRLGFRAVGLTEEYRNGDTTPYIHRPGDTANTVDFDYLASTTKLLTGVIATLASSR